MVIRIFVEMDNYTGIYYIKGGAEYAATFSFSKDKLVIHFTDNQRHERKVFWYYDAIDRSNFAQYGKSTVQYKGYPEQTIVVNSAQFASILEEHIQKQGKKLLLRIFGHSLPFLRILFILAVLLIAVYWWLVPYLAVKLADKVPVSYEENLGNAMYNAMKTEFTIDEKKTSYINAFFDELKIPTPYKIHITVVKSDIVNAFAMPGGNIIVYDKMLAGMDDYSALAALLSHEFTHVQHKHTTKSLFRGAGNSVLLASLLGNTGGVSDAILRNADQLKSLSYGRSLEKEADLDGLKILQERKISGKGFVDLFSVLKKENTIKTAEWTSSHPALDKRIEYIQQSPFFYRGDTADNETLQILFRKVQSGE